MKPRFRISRAPAAVALLFACAPAGPPCEAPLSEAEARTIVVRMIEEWDAANLAGDFEAASAIYTTDAIRMEPDMPPLLGRDAIRAWLQTQAETYNWEGSNEIVEVRALSPEWILHRSRGSFTATPKAGGEARMLQGKWLTLTQRQPDGTWKVYRNAGSSDLPR